MPRHFRDMLVRQTQRVPAMHGFNKDRRIFFLEFLDHAFAAAGITGDAMHRQRKIGRHQPRRHQWPRQRQKAGGPAAGIGHALGRRDGFVTVRRKLREAIGPAISHAVGGGSVNHPHTRIINQGHGFTRRVVRQAQDHQIGIVERLLARAGIFAVGIAEGDQRKLAAPRKPFADLKPRGACRAVYENPGRHAATFNRAVAKKIAGQP